MWKKPPRVPTQMRSFHTTGVLSMQAPTIVDHNSGGCRVVSLRSKPCSNPRQSPCTRVSPMTTGELQTGPGRRSVHRVSPESRSNPSTRPSAVGTITTSLYTAGVAHTPVSIPVRASTDQTTGSSGRPWIQLHDLAKRATSFGITFVLGGGEEKTLDRQRRRWHRCHRQSRNERHGPVVHRGGQVQCPHPWISPPEFPKYTVLSTIVTELSIDTLLSPMADNSSSSQPCTAANSSGATVPLPWSS